MSAGAATVKPLVLGLAGNPNCGKTALFNLMTGIHQRTGNWPGVTVERKEGLCHLCDLEVNVVDLPGIYSLDADSEDERVTRDYLLSGEADLLVNVVDAASLERCLYLTTQILEMDVPMVLAVNMMDVARDQGIEIDLEALSVQLGCPVVPLVAVTGEGMDLLARTVKGEVENGHKGRRLSYDDQMEDSLVHIEALLGERNNRRWLAVKALEGDEFALQLLGEADRLQVHAWRKAVQEGTGVDADLYLADCHYAFANTIAKASIRRAGRLDKTSSDRIDDVVLSRFWGVPIFLLAMYVMFVFTINIGGAFIELFGGVAGALFVDGLGTLLRSWDLPEWLSVVVADGLGGGIQVVATFIPIISALYLFLSVLEDSGYMARAALVMDRAMRAIGLPGKAFVPLIVGFGCNVPAVMATRTLQNERERRLTILMNPFMSCGARLPVYVLFAAAFFPDNGQNLVFLLYLIGILVAVLSGLAMKKTLLAGAGADFLMEMPRYHMPTLRAILLRTWDRLKLFVREAGQIIVVMVLVLNVLNSIGTDGSFGNEDSEHSVLSETGKLVTPLFAPMGIQENNWPATVGIFSGVLAKEVVVGTLDSIYGKLAEAHKLEEKPPFSLWRALGEALATVPNNLAKVGNSLLDPLGLSDAGSDQTEVAKAQQINPGLFGEMQQRFDGQAGAFAYLLFILLYFPCVAVIGAIVREAGGYWAAFVGLWTTGVAYASATIYYQLATFSRHPGSSMGWVVGLLGFVVLCLWLLRQSAVAQPQQRSMP